MLTMRRPRPRVSTLFHAGSSLASWRSQHSLAAAADKGTDSEADYKGESKFATHLKASTAASAFARTRTLKEQREYLPAFASREELLKIIRDNQGEDCV